MGDSKTSKMTILDIRQSKGWSEYLTFLGWNSARTSNDINIETRKVFFGGLVKIQRPKSISKNDLIEITEICKKTFGCGVIDQGRLISKVVGTYGTDVHPQCALVFAWEWLLKEQLSLMKSLKKESQKWEFFLKNFIQEKTAPDDCGNVVILLQDLLKNRLLKREQLERIYTKNDLLASSEQKWLQEVFACLVEELPLL